MRQDGVPTLGGDGVPVDVREYVEHEHGSRQQLGGSFHVESTSIVVHTPQACARIGLEAMIGEARNRERDP
jgi:hypothetical protein